MPETRHDISPESVLIADEDALMATALASSVRSLGFGVVGPVQDGTAAVLLAREQQPDLALIDIALRTDEHTHAAHELWDELRIPCVVVSGLSDSTHVQAAQRVGVFGYLLKPVSIELLRVTLATAWARAVDHANLTKRVVQLENSLENRKLVEKAKWIIIESKGINEHEAHTRLQRAARNNRRSLADVANDVIRAHNAGQPIEL